MARTKVVLWCSKHVQCMDIHTARSLRSRQKTSSSKSNHTRQPAHLHDLDSASNPIMHRGSSRSNKMLQPAHPHDHAGANDPTMHRASSTSNHMPATPPHHGGTAKSRHKASSTSNHMPHRGGTINATRQHADQPRVATHQPCIVQHSTHHLRCTTRPPCIPHKRQCTTRPPCIPHMPQHTRPRSPTTPHSQQCTTHLPSMPHHLSRMTHHPNALAPTPLAPRYHQSRRNRSRNRSRSRSQTNP